ncbi:MAG: L-threonylcarbamoyladenylate synthase, partial [Myxococcota bacterium]
VPTETVYGVAGDAKNPDAIARLFALKGRPDGRPLPVLLPDVDALLAWCPELPGAARALAAAFWPGPLTMVVARPSGLPDALTAGGQTLGVRVPRHPVALALLRAFGGGLATPSANRHGEVSATDAASARAAFGADLGLVLDGGASQEGVESTVVDLTQDPPRVLRVGALPVAAIEAVLGASLKASENPGGSTAFSPKTPTEIISAADLAARCAELASEGLRCAVISPLSAPPPAGARHVAIPDDEAARAREFYARLREADALGLDRVLVADPGPTAWGQAIRQRLRGGG